jgi:hypothetical protein
VLYFGTMLHGRRIIGRLRENQRIPESDIISRQLKVA